MTPRRFSALLLCCGFVACKTGAPSESPVALAAVDQVGARFRAEAEPARLTPTTAGLEPRFATPLTGTVRAAQIVLPASAEGAVAIADSASGMQVHARLLGAQPSPALVANGHAVYLKGFEGGDVVHRPTAEGNEDFVILPAGSSVRSLAYQVHLDSQVAGLRLLDNQLEWLDARGAPRLRIAPPVVVDVEGTRRPATLSVDGCQVDTDLRMPWGRPTVTPGADECEVRVSWDSSGLKGPLIVDPSWQTTGSTTSGHYQHAALALANGRVLICGNGNSEIYDYSTGTWATNGTPNACQSDGSLVFLQSGKVLAAGGGKANYSIWDPSAGVWSEFTEFSGFGSGGAKVVALTDGTVLAFGGYSPCSGTGCIGGVASKKLIAKFNQANNTWGNLGVLLTERRFAMAATFPDNTALVCGGLTSNSSAAHDCELVTAAGATTKVLGPLPDGFQIGQEPNSSMVSLPDGSVFLNCHYGNQGGNSGWIGDSWTYKSGWSSVSLSVDRCEMTAAPLAVGKTLLAGGQTFNNTQVTATDILNVGATTALPVARTLAAAATISDGRVLVSGGQNGTGALRTSYVYTAPVTCSDSSDCLSGFCVDGYCCNSACNSGCGQCNLPGSEGWCSARPQGDSGTPSCAPYACDGTALTCESTCSADADCAATAWCDDTNHCRFKSAPGGSCDAAEECLVGFCVDHICCDRACDGACNACTVAEGATADGTCAQLAGTPGTPACAPFLCGGNSDACPTTCGADDSLCASTDYCDGTGNCVEKVNYPAACTADNQCTTGLCANGTCCNEGCHDGCGTCAAASGATADGVCTALPIGEPGAPSCAPYLCDGSSTQCAATCAADADCASGNWCNASHKCVAQAAKGGACSADNQCTTSLHCTQNVCCDQTCSGGCEACTAATGATADGTCTVLTQGAAGLPGCGNYVCTGSATTCPNTCASDAGCADTAWCDATNHCVPKVAKGSVCAGDNECLTDHCSDAVCCDTTCGGACDACSKSKGASVDGTCATVVLGNAGSPVCAPFVCTGSGVSCPTTCSVDTQCVDGDYCDASHNCVPRLPTGNSCGGDHECESKHCADSVCCDQACNGACDACSAAAGATVNGTCTNISGAGAPTCAPYLCLGAAASCPATCQNDAQCATGNYCDAANHCVPKGAQSATCSANNQCLNGRCSDGFCCDTSCDAACDACSKAKGATANGTCTTVALGSAGLPVCAPYVCDGTATSCPTTCVTDSQCDAADYCDASKHCVPKKTGGSTCGANNECQSTSCADGFCCDKSCGGGCDVCAASLGATANGTCTILPAVSPGFPSCSPYVCGGTQASCPTTCTTDANCIAGDYCDSTNHCVPKINGGGTCSADNQCSTTHCSDGRCCDKTCGDSCDVCSASLGASANGVCTVVGGAGAPVCAPYLCGGTVSTCPNTCASDAACSTGNYCDAAHHCVAKGGQGAVCGAANQCLNGKCVDGFCCNSDCGSGCDACAVSKGAVANGVCTILTAGSIGAPSCAPFVCSGQAECPLFCTKDSQCESGKYCDGSGACVPLLPSAHACGSAHECSSGSCADGLCCDTDCLGSCDRCDLTGHLGVCSPVPAGPSDACRPLQCDGTTASCPAFCMTSGDCADGFACIGETCQPMRVPGATCSQSADCASGFCVDGVCCNSACEGSCSACALPGKAGTCTLVTGGAAPGREACGGSGLCAATCDGQHTSCQFPSTTATCGPAFCSQAMETQASFCDGQGTCVAGGQTACGAGCDGDHCVPAPKTAGLGCASFSGADLLALLSVLTLLGVRRRPSFRGGL